MRILTPIAVISGLLLSGVAGESQAAPLNYVDTYWGGDDGSLNRDVIGSISQFEIFSLDVERVLNNLVVTINTNYSGANVGALGTKVGALFIGDPAKLNYNGSSVGTGAAPTYNNDVFTNDKDRFSYAFDFDLANPGTPGIQNGTGALYQLSGTGSDVLLSQNLTPSGDFRRDQAVDIRQTVTADQLRAGKTAAVDTGLNGSWAIGANSVSFSITNFFGGSLPGLYSTSLTLAWAITCANDVILTTAIFPGQGPSEVPLPAGLTLLLSGLLGLGFLARGKKVV
ncbi:MAG TPA: hypothetical protein VM144_17945 [Aestuariivirga sp.]|nr:hypothetical protein [Aestuariivirga sp.]